MTLKEAIELKILFVRDHDYNNFTKEVLSELFWKIHFMPNEYFDYDTAMRLINNETPTKLGGQYIDLSKSISFLKQEIRAVKKQYKSLL